MHEEHIAVQYIPFSRHLHLFPQAILHPHDIISKTVSGATALLDNHITGFNIPSSNSHPHSMSSTSRALPTTPEQHNRPGKSEL